MDPRHENEMKALQHAVACGEVPPSMEDEVLVRLELLERIAALEKELASSESIRTAEKKILITEIETTTSLRKQLRAAQERIRTLEQSDWRSEQQLGWKSAAMQDLREQLKQAEEREEALRAAAFNEGVETVRVVVGLAGTARQIPVAIAEKVRAMCDELKTLRQQGPAPEAPPKLASSAIVEGVYGIPDGWGRADTPEEGQE